MGIQEAQKEVKKKMSKVEREIRKNSHPDDIPILLGLFSKYHWQSQWNFVTKCTMVRDTTQKWNSRRVWSPSEEGRILYAYYHSKGEI